MTSPADGSRGQTARPVLLLTGVLFLASRLLVLPFPQPFSDVAIYAQYAWEQQVAARRGVSFYDVHAEAGREQARKTRVTGSLAASSDEYETVEYPPLALVVMRLPTLWMGGQATGEELTPAFIEEYSSAYRLGLAFVDAGLFALVVILVRWLYPREGGGEWMGRLLAYLASTLALWYLLYDRLDLIQAALVVLALALLLSRLHYGWSFAVLALAINFKLTPVVLAPVWVVGSWPGNRALALSRPRVLAALGGRAVLLLGMVAGCFLPFYLSAGNHWRDFLNYHLARGIEFESLYGSLLMALQGWGQAIKVRFSYGSINLDSSLSPVLQKYIAPCLAAGLLLAATALLLVHARRLAARDAGEGPSRGSLARLHPRVFACYALLFLMAFIAGGKVFSPQYLLWLAPLVALTPLAGRGRRLFLWGFVGVCVLSTVVCPFLLVADMIDRTSPEPGAAWGLKAPTVRLAVILAIRNLLFLGLMASLAVHLFRRARGPRPNPPVLDGRPGPATPGAEMPVEGCPGSG
jgi:hypothetical protein